MSFATVLSTPSIVEQQGEPKRRAYHSKSRGGCRTCKQRHVRCDERHPVCSPCGRLHLTCAFTPIKHPTKPQHRYQRTLRDLLPAATAPKSSRLTHLITQQDVQPPRPKPLLPATIRTRRTGPAIDALSQHIWTAEDTARNIVYDAFATLDPIGNSQANPFAHILPRESYDNESYRFICLAIRDLSSSRDINVRRMSFRKLKATPSKNEDRCVLSAVRNYTQALAAFRAALGRGMSARNIAIGTFCFAILELMQGNFPARQAIMSAGIALLRPWVSTISRSDGSVGYGMHLMYEGERMVLYIEGLILRSAANCVLGGGDCAGGNSMTRQVVTAREALTDNRNLRDDLLPDFNLPVEFAIPLDTDSKMELQRKWNAFHNTLESWHLSRYWPIVGGTLLDAHRHLTQQKRLWKHLHLWLTTIQHLASSSAFPATNNNEHDHDLPMVPDLLACYIQCLLVAMAGPIHYDQSDDLHAEIGDISHDQLRALTLQPVNKIDGFRTTGTNILFFDSAILPVITAQALEQLNRSSADSHERSLPFTPSTASPMQTSMMIQSMPGLHPKVFGTVERQLSLLHMQLSVVQDGFNDHERGISLGKVADFHFMPLSARKQFSLASLPGPAMMAERALRVGETSCLHFPRQKSENNEV